MLRLRPAGELLPPRELSPLPRPGDALLPRHACASPLRRGDAFLLQPGGELPPRHEFVLLLQHANAPRLQRVDALPLQLARELLLRLAVGLPPRPACAQLRLRHVCALNPGRPSARSPPRAGSELLHPRVDAPLLRHAC